MRARRRSVPPGPRALATHARRACALGAFAWLSVAVAASPSAIAVGGGKIEGTVLAAASKAPIEGVSVCASPEVNLEYPVPASDEWCTTTASSGHYAIGGLEAREFRVEFSDTSLQYVTQFYNGKADYFKATPVSVSATGATSGIDASLKQRGSLTGLVINASTKAPVAGIEACARPTEGPSEKGICSLTDGEGRYTISALVPGGYIIHFNTGELNYLAETPMRDYTRGVTVTSGNTASAVTLEIKEGGEVTGKVVGFASKAPLAQTQVCAQGDGPALDTKCARTDASGAYTISGLETSAYFMWFGGPSPYVEQIYPGVNHRSEATVIHVTEGAVVSGIDEEMRIGGTVTGHVTSASTHAPMPGTKVCAWVNDGELGLCAIAGAGGEYSIAGLPEGTAAVEFLPIQEQFGYRDQYWDRKEVSTEATPVAITLEATKAGIDGELHATYGAITGKVVKAGTTTPLEEIWACAQTVTKKEVVACVKTNAAGEYQIHHLWAGEYIVEFSSYPSAQFEKQFFDEARTIAEARPVPVIPGKVSAGIDGSLHERTGGSISGLVSNRASGAAIAGIEVCALQSGGRGEPACAVTDFYGEYTIEGLAAGGYFVEFISPAASGLNFITQFYNGVSSPAEANVVWVTNGVRTTGINARMSEGGRILGKVVAASSKTPLAGIEVCAYEFAGEGFAGGCAITSASGEYAIAGLPAGEYAVEFFTPPETGLNYVTQYYKGQSLPSRADPVRVSAGLNTGAIDAELVPGGAIAGHVTDATTLAAVGEVLVCALASISEAVGCAITNPAGEYVIGSLPKGSFAVGFARRGYAVQYYDDKCAFSEATAVAVTPEMTVRAIDASLRRECARPALPPPHGVLPSPPPPPPPTPSLAIAPFKAAVTPERGVVSLVGSTVTVRSNGLASVRLSCSRATSCHVRLTLWLKRSATIAGKQSSHIVTLGTATATIPGGRTSTVKLRLHVSLARLFASGKSRIAARLTIAARGAHRTIVIVHLVRAKGF